MSKSKGTDIVTIALLGALGVGGFLIFKNRKEIGNFFGGIGEGVQDFTDGIGNWYGETVTNIQKGVDDIGKNVGGFFDGIVKGTTGFFGDLSGSYVNFIGGIQDTVTGIQKGAGEFADSVGNFFGGIADGIGDFFGGKRVTEEAPEPVKAPEESKTPIMQGSPSSQDLSKYEVKNKALYDRIYGEGNYEVIGAPLKMTEEEKKSRPVLSIDQLAEKDNFIGRVAKLAKEKLNL